MATNKPKAAPATDFPSTEPLHRAGDWLWIPLRSEWRNVAAKPEEIVRQTFIRHLVENYGYSLDQMDQERRTMHGHKSPRADIVVWETATKKANNNTPALVPLPPLDDQRALIEALDAGRSEAARLRAEATAARAKAWAAFEASVYADHSTEQS